MGDREGCSEFAVDTEIAEAILQAAVAGGLRYWARRSTRQPDKTALIKGADGRSAAATALLNSWTARHLAKVAGRSAFGGE